MHVLALQYVNAADSQSIQILSEREEDVLFWSPNIQENIQLVDLL